MSFRRTPDVIWCQNIVISPDDLFIISILFHVGLLFCSRGNVNLNQFIFCVETWRTTCLLDHWPFDWCKRVGQFWPVLLFLLLAETWPDGMNESRRWKSLGRLPSSIKQGDWHICRRVIRPVQLYSRLIFVVKEDILRQFAKRSSSMLMTKSNLLW